MTAAAAAADRIRSTRRRRRRHAALLPPLPTMQLVLVLLASCSAAAAAAASTTTTMTALNSRQAGATAAQQALRWGAAAAQLDGLLLLHGGKASSNAGYTYSSAPDSSDLLILNLTQPFALASPPWQSLSTPATASFHSLSPLSRTRFLLFGGQSNLAPTPSGNDSLYILDLSDSANPSWTAAASAEPGWNQPMRRMLHSAPSDPVAQSLSILGGERADGSAIPTQQLWSFTASANTFTEVLPAPPVNIIDGAAPLLADGTIVLIGGLSSGSALASMNTITSYSPQTRSWTTTQVAAAGGNTSFPAPRRAHVAVPLPDNRIFIHGGASADLAQPLADAWVLDWSQSPPLWSPISTGGSNNDAPTARFAHSAVSYGSNIVLGYGWAGNNAADTSLWVWDGTQARLDAASGNTVGGIWVGAASAATGTTSGGSGSVPSYIPDPNAQPQSNGLGWVPAGSSSSGSSGSNANAGTGGHSPSSSSGSGSASTKSHSPTKSADPTGGIEHKGNPSTPAGAKAGIILGALMGLGLAAGAGYYAYRAYQNYHHPYGGAGGGPGYGKAALLGHGSSGGGAGSGAFDDDGFTQHPGSRAGGGAGAMWSSAGAAAAAAAVSGFLSSSLAGKKRRRGDDFDGLGPNDTLMLEKGVYRRLGDAQRGDFDDEDDSPPSPTGAVLGTPAVGAGGGRRRGGANRLGAGGVGERLLPPIGPRGPKALTRNEYYSAVVEAEQQRLYEQRNLGASSAAAAAAAAKGRGWDRSEGSMGGGGEIPMAGGAAALAAAQAGVKAGVRDKIARLVGAGGGASARHHPDGGDEHAFGGGSGGARGSSSAPRRLDILADEDADEEALRRKYPKQYGAARHLVDPFADHLGLDEEEDEDDVAALGRSGEAGARSRAFGGGGYGALRTEEDEDGEGYDEDGPTHAGRAASQQRRYVEPAYRDQAASDEGRADGYVVSPFEDSAAAIDARPARKQVAVSVRPVVNFRGSTLAVDPVSGSGSGSGRESAESSRSGAAAAAAAEGTTARRAANPTTALQQPQPLFSNILNMPASTSASGGGMAVAWADGGGPGADHSNNNGGGAGAGADDGGDDGSGARSPLMRRSATWWDRFMATSFLDRSSSGALAKRLTTMAPTAVDPIRDPRRLNDSTTSLATVAESLRAEVDPFGDEHGAVPMGPGAAVAYDEHGRPKLAKLATASSPGAQAGAGASARVTTTPDSSASGIVQPHGGKHTRSLSSLQSARTATSSVLEAQLAGMDVIQRTHTLSSSRGAPSSAGVSEDGTSSLLSTPLSRGPSLRDHQRRQHGGTAGVDLASVAEDEDTSLNVWDGNPWTKTQLGDQHGRFDDADTSSGPDADRSADIVEQRSAGNANDPTFGVELRKSPLKKAQALTAPSHLARSNSEAPSITPSITKRSRQNRQLTLPVSPLLTHTPPAPILGSVRERVEALERKYSADDVSLASSSHRSAGAQAAGDVSGNSNWLGNLAFHHATMAAGGSLPHPHPGTSSPGSVYTTMQPESMYAPTTTTTATTAPSASSHSSGHGIGLTQVSPSASARTGSTRMRTRSNSPTRMAGTAAPPKLGGGPGTHKPPSVSSSAGKTSATGGSGANGRTRTTVGLVPKAQLFVANPDREGSLRSEEGAR
ncbi:hypothetical protein OC834_006000 [Tilletia horrida]|nr:hypothetical protein OC834_006000 [Tilletia horrida]